MADRLEKDLGINVKLYDVSSEGMIIQALRFGNADIGFMEGGPAWIAWQEYNLEVLAVETTTSSNDTYYNAAAWVLANSTMAQYYLDDDETTDPFAALEGKTSSSHRLVKICWNVDADGILDCGNGYVTPVGDGEDINSTEGYNKRDILMAQPEQVIQLQYLMVEDSIRDILVHLNA